MKSVIKNENQLPLPFKRRGKEDLGALQQIRPADSGDA